MNIDNLWLFICFLLVFMMIPGLAFVGAGVVREKNSLSQLIQPLMMLPISFFVFLFVGFNFIFERSGSALLGHFSFDFLSSIEKGGETISSIILRFLFQWSFFAIAHVLIVGVIAERVSLKKILLFNFLWGLLVYLPVAFWVWNSGGWIHHLGAIDFAGGLVVHISTGFTALALTISLGRRSDYFKLIKKYNNGLIYLGTFLLWIGWLGFNGGSTSGFNSMSIQAVFNSLISSLASLLVWFIIDLIHTPHKSYLSYLCISLISGLVVVTPLAPYLSPSKTILLGSLAGLVGNYSVRFMHKVFNQDDVLDVFSSHGVCGLLGSIIGPFFLSNQFLIENSNLITGNFLGSTFVAVYSFVVSLLLVRILGGRKNFKVSLEVEEEGLDLIHFGESIINIKKGPL